jgi:type 1 glutamine amidotransferase
MKKTLLVFTALAALLWAPVNAQRDPLRIFIRAGEKTHGPAGNGLHDYPTFLTDWTKLLTERGATVQGALRFPTADELAKTDVLIIFKGDGGTCSPEERAVLEPYVKRGGGLVVLHDGMCSDDAVWFSKIAGAAKQHGERNFSAGLLKMHFTDTAHPITKGLPDYEIDDEAFFLLRTAPGMKVLASAPLPMNGEGAPQVWVYETTVEGGKPYRSFVSMQGHHYKTFSVPVHQRLILRGIAWAGKRDVNQLLPKTTSSR